MAYVPVRSEDLSFSESISSPARPIGVDKAFLSAAIFSTIITLICMGVDRKSPDVSPTEG